MCAFGLSEKVCTQARCVSFVEPGSRDELAFRQRMDDKAHRSAALGFLNTFPAGAWERVESFNASSSTFFRAMLIALPCTPNIQVLEQLRRPDLL
jgi:hypothetical protein